MSPASRGRGLKQWRAPSIDTGSCTVARLARAWIETLQGFMACLNDYGVARLARAWIETPREPSAIIRKTPSPASRGRGLKRKHHPI